MFIKVTSRPLIHINKSRGKKQKDGSEDGTSPSPLSPFYRKGNWPPLLERKETERWGRKGLLRY